MSETMPVVHVVDDDTSFLVALARLLKASGYAVQTYASAADFLAKLGDGAGCVVTDLRMPGMDGLDLQQALARGTNIFPGVFRSGSPGGGATRSWRRSRRCAWRFHPRPPRGERLLRWVWRKKVTRFRSAPPAWGATFSA